MRYEDLASIFTAHMSLAVNVSSALRCFQRGNVVKICYGIIFDFYLDYHILLSVVHISYVHLDRNLIKLSIACGH